jgi:hypothetical protein
VVKLSIRTNQSRNRAGTHSGSGKDVRSLTTEDCAVPVEPAAGSAHSPLTV